MISKELLSEVLEKEDIEDIKVLGNWLTCKYYGHNIKVNIHELAYKCIFHFSKAHLGYEFVIMSNKILIVKNENIIFEEVYEPRYDVNIIFKACEYILDNKDK
jgi:hypothetical protein